MSAFRPPYSRLGDTPIGFAGFLSKDAIIESAFAGGEGVARYAFLDAGDSSGDDKFLQLAPDFYDVLRQRAR